MKTNNNFRAILSLMIGVFIMGIFTTLSSCSKDDETTTNNDCSNCFTYANGGNPQTVKIENVFYLLDDDEMTLFFVGINNEMIEITLKSDIDFSGIREGTYTESGSTKFTKAVHTEDDGDKNYSVNGISRQISITKSGNNYNAHFEFTSGVGLTKGNYTGEILQGQRI